MPLRRGVTAALALLALAVPTAARADAAPSCRIPPGTPVAPDAARVQSLVATGVGSDVEPTLGAQYAGMWLHPSDGTWYAGIAPGALTVEAAQALIGERVGTRLSPADADFLRERLRVVAEPYAWADLRAVRDQVFRAIDGQKWDVGVTAGIGCSASDAWRVEVLLFNDASKFVTLATKVITGRHGDRVILRRLNTAPPKIVSVSPGPVKPTAAARSKVAPLRVADLVSYPRNCVRGSSARVRATRESVRRLTATVHGRRVVARDSVLSVTVAKGHPTATRLGITLDSGRTLAATVRFSRCAV